MHTWKLVTALTLYECVGGNSIHVVTSLHKGHGLGALFLLSSFTDGRSEEGLRTDRGYLLSPSVDRGAWWAAVHGIAQGQTQLKPLSMHACTGEGNGNTLQYCCLENPRDRGGWWAAVYGVAQSHTRLKRLSSSRSRHYSTWKPQREAGTEADGVSLPRWNLSSVFLSLSGQQEVISTRPPAPTPVKLVAGNQSS